MNQNNRLILIVSPRNLLRSVNSATFLGKLTYSHVSTLYRIYPLELGKIVAWDKTVCTPATVLAD
ncbi:MAG: hypothetical protein AAFQ23_01900 [Cyanobacteria bacterium J06623_1]